MILLIIDSDSCSMFGIIFSGSGPNNSFATESNVFCHNEYSLMVCRFQSMVFYNFLDCNRILIELQIFIQKYIKYAILFLIGWILVSFIEKSSENAYFPIILRRVKELHST